MRVLSPNLSAALPFYNTLSLPWVVLHSSAGGYSTCHGTSVPVSVLFDFRYTYMMNIRDVIESTSETRIGKLVPHAH